MKINQKCVHEGLQKCFKKSTAFATDFWSKNRPQNDLKSALGGLLEASWDLLGSSRAPLGALSRASWSLLMVFKLPWSSQDPQKPSKGARKELKTVPKHLRKGC